MTTLNVSQPESNEQDKKSTIGSFILDIIIAISLLLLGLVSLFLYAD